MESESAQYRKIDGEAEAKPLPRKSGEKWIPDDGVGRIGELVERSKTARLERAVGQVTVPTGGSNPSLSAIF
jgi:hypothetical protein